MYLKLFCSFTLLFSVLFSLIFLPARFDFLELTIFICCILISSFIITFIFYCVEVMDTSVNDEKNRDVKVFDNEY